MLERSRKLSQHKWKLQLPGTLDVSTVCMVGGGAAAATEARAGAWWVGLGGCSEPGWGPWTTPVLVTGINPLGGGEGATTCGLFPGTGATCDVRGAAEPGPGCIGWKEGMVVPWNTKENLRITVMQKRFWYLILHQMQIYWQDTTENPTLAADIAPHFSAQEELKEWKASLQAERKQEAQKISPTSKPHAKVKWTRSIYIKCRKWPVTSFLITKTEQMLSFYNQINNSWYKETLTQKSTCGTWGAWEGRNIWGWDAAWYGAGAPYPLPYGELTGSW